MERDPPPDGASDELAATSQGATPRTSIDGFLRDVARAPAVPIPETIGRYRILRRLGAGGMGVVYAAHDPKLDRPVAIKVLRERAADRAHLGARLEREAQALARVTHPNVVSVFDVGVDDGVVHVVMQRIDGTTLDRALAARPHTPAEILALFRAAGRGLMAAHAVGLVHRDFKPSNVLVDADGTPRITDFGLALLAADAAVDDDPGSARELAAGSPRLTQTGMILGTPAYMAPEQFAGRHVDAATDQFSFCVALWEALCGRRPFAGDSVEAIRAAVVTGTIDAPPRGLARPVERALRRGLAIDPAQRFASMADLLAALALPGRRGWGLASALAVVAAGGAVVAVAVSGGRTTGPRAAAPPKVPSAQVPFVPRVAVPTVLTHLGGCADNPTFLDEQTVIFELDGQLKRLDLTTSEVTPLQAEPVYGLRPARGASAAEVVFEGQGIEAIELGSGRRRPIANGGGGVFAGGAYYHGLGVTIARSVAGVDAPVLTIPDGRTAYSLTASNDGQRLVTIIYAEKAPPKLCTIEVAHPELRCSKMVVSGGRPAFSADGRAVYFGRFPGIQRLTLATNIVEYVLPTTVGAGGLAVSPSGATLVTSECNAAFQLAWDVQDDHHAAFPPEHLNQAAIGPGGRLAYVRTDDDGDHLVYQDTTGPSRTLVGGAWITKLAFAPDGKRIAYVRTTKSDAGIYVVTTPGVTAPNRLTENPADDHPVFAGGGIVFTRWLGDGQPRLMRVDLDGTNERVASPRPRFVIGADLVRDRVLVANPAQDFLYWWDPRDQRERQGPAVIDGALWRDIALSPSGTWLVVAYARAAGLELWRSQIDPSGEGHVVDTITMPAGINDITLAIDDDGHVLSTIDRWLGELAIAHAPPGAPW